MWFQQYIIDSAIHTYLGSAAEAMERLGMTVQPGQAEQLKQFTQVPQLDRILGLWKDR